MSVFNTTNNIQRHIEEGLKLSNHSPSLITLSTWGDIRGTKQTQERGSGLYGPLHITVYSNISSKTDVTLTDRDMHRGGDGNRGARGGEVERGGDRG